MALLTDDTDVIDKAYKDFTAEMQSEGHSFFVFLSQNPNGLASCCRLMNEIDENTFSFTNGLTGVQTGSCNVITLNINRIVQDYVRLDYQSNRATVSPKDFMEYGSFPKYLTSILERVYKYHIAYKTMLYEIESQGMLTSSSAGYIYMSKLFNTIGLNGINEAAEFLGIQCNDNEDYARFCNLITSTIKEQNKLHSTKKFKFNTEFVPAESLGAKNYEWDKADGYWVPEDRNLYNSYFYLAHDNTSVLEKLRLHGKKYTGNLDGGVGCHINLEDHPSKEQCLKLMDYAIAHGTSYYTFNVPNSQCDDCGFIAKKGLTKCPWCQSKNITQWSRIIGYLRPIKAFSRPRAIEASHRTYSKEIC